MAADLTLMPETMSRAIATDHPSLPIEYLESRWYVAQTCSRHEKRVAEQLRGRGIEHFLPLYETISRWKDRRARLHLPLFAGYIFVRLPLRERLRALEIPSVVRLVGFGGAPTPLSDHEIQAMRNGLDGRFRAVPHPFLKAGRRVRIMRGPFEGLEGILLRRRGQSRFVLSLDLIKRSVAVDVDVADIHPCLDHVVGIQNGPD